MATYPFHCTCGRARMVANTFSVPHRMITNLQEIKDACKLPRLVEHLGKTVKRNRCGCPVHGGDDDNFRISRSGYSGTCYSQCAGKNWDALELLQELRGYTFLEAAEEMATIAGMKVEWLEKRDPAQIAQAKQQAEHDAALRIAVQAAIDVYATPDVDPIKSYTFGTRSLKGETVKAFGFGIAPNENTLLAAAREGRADEELLLELGLIAEGKKDTRYDLLRDRITVALHDHNGRPVGLAGRVTETNTHKAKWMNSPASSIFRRPYILFGLSQNKRNIADLGALVMEGYFDVATLYDVNIRHALACMGTSLGDAHAELLARYTDRCTLLFDGDEPGKTAARKAIPVAIAAGLTVAVCFLPDGYDPDKYAREKGGVAMLKYLEEESTDGFKWLIGEYLKKEETKEEGMNFAAQMMIDIQSEYRRAEYEEWLEKQLGKRQASVMAKKIGALESKREDEKKRPRYTGAQIEQIKRYALFMKDRKMWVAERESEFGVAISNFEMRPVMMIMGSEESNCLIELENEHQQRATIVINTDNMTEIGPFKKELLRRGNFLFSESMRPAYFIRATRMLMEMIRKCSSISVLGWHRAGEFYAWGNGLSLPTGEFLPVDDNGIVTHGEQQYYLPAFSKANVDMYGDDDKDGYENQRDFILQPSLPCPTIKEWSTRFVTVHGDNGRVGLAWYVAAIYRDIIYGTFDCFPLLNLFGQPGSGKSFMGMSISAMFGKARRPFNLNDGTDVGLFRRLAQVRNGVQFLDEYSNQIHPRRIQALKNAFDGAGREKGRMTNDNSTTTTSVNSAIILGGQQQPMEDAALFSRVLALNFTPIDHTEEQKREASELKKIESTACLSQLTAQLLRHRKVMAETYEQVYDTVLNELSRDMPSDVKKDVLSRMLKNNAMVLTAFRIITEREEMGCTYEEVAAVMKDGMIRQLYAINEEDDLATWWNVFEYFVTENEIVHDRDILVTYETNLLTQSANSANKNARTWTFDPTAKILFLHPNTAYRKYKERLRKENAATVLNQEAVKHYLRNSAAYMGEAVKKIGGVSKRVMCFDMDRLHFDLEISANLRPGHLTDEDEPPSSVSRSSATATATKVKSAMKATTNSPGKFPTDGEDLPF